jgi:hypothetical protein
MMDINSVAKERKETTTDINSICKECKEKTRISYKYDGRFFIPKLLSINYLQLGNSRLLRNPIILIIEWLLRQFRRLRSRLQALSKWLFPRRSKVWCHQADSQLVGSIHYADRDELDKPIHNLRVEFWGRTWWLQWRLLSAGYTDYDGKFSLSFELRQARNWKIGRAQFEVYQTTHVYFKNEVPSLQFERCYLQLLNISNLTGMRYNLRTINLSLWEYRRDANVPRTRIINVTNNSPQYYSQGRLDALYQQIVPLEVIKVKHLAQIADAPETISLQEIQNDYAENLTRCIEKKAPGYTRSDEWFGERMMNGMNRGSFLPDKNEPNVYWVKYFGVCNYEHNNEYALPTTEIKFEIDERSFPRPLAIHLTGPTNAFDKNPWQKKIVTKLDGEEWMFAKRVARVAGGFSTEVDEHFTGTHLNTEQYAIAAYRNFRQNPLACLLFPHLKEVALINHTADKVIIHGYIPTATALTENGIHDRTRDVLGMQDWKNWHPMKALCERHDCAKADQLFWEVLVEYVDDFFEKNLAEIRKHWREVYHFSQDLVDHAVPVFLSDKDLNKLSPAERKLAEDRFEYYSFQYGFDTKAKRARVNDQLKAVSPITMTVNSDDVLVEDVENIKQVCCYAIMMATYMHTWINEHQYDDMGEVLYNCGGLRFGSKERGIMAPEDDLSIAPDLTRSTEMLWLTNFLSRTEYGFITKNEEGDVNPEFSRRLLAKKEQFAGLGVDVHAIESRTNI